jgi:hypothetical protein
VPQLLALSEEAYAVVAAEVDPKMMVQQSGFTIHGSPMPLNRHQHQSDFLIRLTIPAGAKPTLRRELQEMGIRDMTLFPDLHHLASDLRSATYS